MAEEQIFEKVGSSQPKELGFRLPTFSNETLSIVRKFMEQNNFSLRERAQVYKIFYEGLYLWCAVHNANGTKALFLVTKKEGDAINYRVVRSKKTEEYPERVDKNKYTAKDELFRIDSAIYLQAIAAGAATNFLEGDSPEVFAEIFTLRPEFGGYVKGTSYPGGVVQF